MILGLDIGGANLKAAHTDRSARAIPFALWKHPERLAAELRGLCVSMSAHDQLAITMTGELCDCFVTKREGVRAILQSVHEFAGARSIRVWTTKRRFVDWQNAWDDPLCVAAANWLALAQFVAATFPDERLLLIDIGSTTTDLVYLHQGKPEPRGFNDYARLTYDELVYTGVRRTPLCAVMGIKVAAEWFATMLDAYLVLGLLPENPDDCDTADGRPATRACAHARLARMLCADTESFGVDRAHALAKSALKRQWVRILEAVRRVLLDKPPIQKIVLAGSGEVLGRVVCARPELRDIPIVALSELLGPQLSEAACAYAVAVLASRKQQ
jgi:(4-(4-[2-(gamma-L-glutamylamino)ethyl]phenoxymethyl)furan-2-yl)methanamine synthase